MFKRFFGLMVGLSLLLAALCALVPAMAEEAAIALYFVPESIKGKVTLPKDARTSYQFPEGSSVVYTIGGDPGTSEDYAVRVSEGGLAVCQSLPNYHYDPELDQFINYGNEDWSDRNVTVTVKRDGQTRKVTFRAINAKYLYADQVMDNYLNTEITSSMTELEKVDKVAEIVARNYDYGNHSTWQSCIWYGNGDCYAASGFIVEACRRLGIQAGLRQDHMSGGSDHRNVLALIGDQLYVIEVGKGNKPRQHSHYAMTDFLYSYCDASHETVDLYRYERLFAKPELAKTIVVPDTYMGGVVTQIGCSYIPYNIYFGGLETRTLILPARLEVIHPYAFYWHESLTDLTLPDTLTTIGEGAFMYCRSLGSLVIPPKVTEIKARTFEGCGTLKLTVPSTVTSIAGDCFADTDVTLVVEPGSYAERYARSNGIKTVYSGACELPAATRRIEGEAFAGSLFRSVVIPNGAVYIGSKAFANCPNLKSVSIPNSVSFISDDAFSGDTGVTIIASAGSYTAAFAASHGITRVDP